MPTESIAIKKLGESPSALISEAQRLIVPFVETPDSIPSLEDFFLPPDFTTGEIDASAKSKSVQGGIPLGSSECSLVASIANELRSFSELRTLQTTFWELLGYQRVGERVPHKMFSPDVWKVIQEANFLARHEGIYVLVIRLEEGRFTHRWRDAILSQARSRLATAIIWFSDFGWSRMALGWTVEGAASLLKPLRLWPLAKIIRVLLAETLAGLRTYDDEDLPRGTLELAESICRLGKCREIEANTHEFQEPSVDPDRLYDRLFAQCPLMKRDETQGLLLTLAALRPEEREGSRKEEYVRLRDRLICGHIRLCARVIKHYGLLRKCKSLAWPDLMQEGIFGLVRAIEYFDTNRSTKFSTYAFPWIRQAINRAIENKDRLIRIPAHCWRGEDRLQESEWRRFSNILSLSVNECGIAHELAEAQDNDPLNHLIRRELEHTLGEGVQECLRAVNGRWREILERRFGLGGRKPQTLQEIADILGLTRERVRQLESKAVEKIRNLRILDRFPDLIDE